MSDASPDEPGDAGDVAGASPGADAPAEDAQEGATEDRAVPDGDGAAGGRALLEIEDLRKTFGGLSAVDGASFGVEAGSITGLIGPNGAGKSTTFDLVTGFTEPDGGEVYFEGRPITEFRPNRIARAGLVRTFQITREFPEMTVLENLLLAPPDQRGESLLHAVPPGLRSRVVEQERELVEEVWETLDFFEIDHLAEEYARSLSGGQRKLLELARALQTDPSVLLLDEPMAGVNPSLETKLLDRIHDLREDGYTFLIVEHDIDLIMEHCDRVIVMHQGQVIADGDPADVRTDERVIDAYLGEDV